MASSIHFKQEGVQSLNSRFCSFVQEFAGKLFRIDKTLVDGRSDGKMIIKLFLMGLLTAITSHATIIISMSVFIDPLLSLGHQLS